MSFRIVRRNVREDGIGLPQDLHPVLRRVYAARAVHCAEDYAYSLDQLLPLAALGFLSPVVAGAAMAASSVSVVSNALLLRRHRAER